MIGRAIEFLLFMVAVAGAAPWLAFIVAFPGSAP